MLLHPGLMCWSAAAAAAALIALLVAADRGDW
jgi:hypothetical protein